MRSSRQLRKVISFFVILVLLSADTLYALAPPSEDEKFVTLRKVSEAVGAAKVSETGRPTGRIVQNVVEDPQSVLRGAEPSFIGKLISVAGETGPFLTVAAVFMFLAYTYAQAGPLSELAGGIQRGNNMTVFEIAAIVLPLIMAVSIILYIIKRIKDNEAEELRSRRELMKALIDVKDTPFGRAYEEEGFRVMLESSEPLAVFDRDGDKFVLAKEYEEGLNEVSRRILSDKKVPMDAIKSKGEKIASMISGEPRGGRIKRIIIVNQDPRKRVIHIHIRSATIIIVLSFLDYEAILAASSVPHEVYHLALALDSELYHALGIGTTASPVEALIRENLVGALAYVRRVNIYRSGKHDSGYKNLFEQYMKESILFENEALHGDHTVSNNVSELIRIIDEKEKNTGKELSSEEVLKLSVPYKWRSMKKQMENLRVLYEDDILTMSDEDMTKRVMAMFYDRKNDLLAGRPLFSVIVPFLALDFVDFVLRSWIGRVILGTAVFGMMFQKRSDFGGMLTDVWNRLSGRFLPAKLIDGIGKPFPQPQPFSTNFQNTIRQKEILDPSA